MSGLDLIGKIRFLFQEQFFDILFLENVFFGGYLVVKNRKITS